MSGTYTDILTNNYGCDSIVTTQLTVLSISGGVGSNPQTICIGDSIVVGNNVYYNVGIYTDTLQTNNGCDSVVNTTLTVLPASTDTLTIEICDGDSVVIGNSIYTLSGTYTDILTNSYGCDSTVYANIVINDNTYSYDTLAIIPNINLYWNNILVNVSGDYSVTLINSVGCDSIANLNLTVTTTGVLDITNNKSSLVKITDMLGQETPYRRNTPLFYIYDDGTVEKRIVIE